MLKNLLQIKTNKIINCRQTYKNCIKQFLYYTILYRVYIKIQTYFDEQIYNQNHLKLVRKVNTMFILMPCATIKDNVQLSSGDGSGLQFNGSRNTIKKYTDVEYLLQRIQEGEVIMMKKVQFDNYLKGQVDLMRNHVQKSVASPFSYVGYMDPSKTISTAGMGIKQQWAIEMVISRYNICSIYHAAAYSSLEYIFTETSNSYSKAFKESAKFVNHLQISFKYFNEGYQPLKRLSQSYDTLKLLLTPNSESIVEVKKQVFLLMKDLVACNMAYLKLEKYRLMAEYRSCKQLAYAIHLYLVDVKKKLKSSNIFENIHPDIIVYLNIGELFFLCYSYYFLLEQHEDLKHKEEYGFIKKQFQEMIVQNGTICQQFIKVQSKIENFPGKQSLDNVMFADNLTKTMLAEVKKKQYTYGINIHENKIEPVTIQEVVAKRISSRNIWQTINQF